VTFALTRDMLACAGAADDPPRPARAAALLRRALEGDADAFPALVRPALPAVHALALALVRRADDADDVVQNAVIRCWERLAQCRDPERFRSWMLQIARRAAYDWLRREGRRRAEPLDAADGRGADPAAARDLREELLRAMRVLRPVEREVLVLFDLEDWPHRDIADALGISEAMSRRRLSDARRRMRQALDHPDRTT